MLSVCDYISFIFSFTPALFCARISAGGGMHSKNKAKLTNINYGNDIYIWKCKSFVLLVSVKILTDFKLLFIIPEFINTNVFMSSTEKMWDIPQL